jgi:hypothetical protein
MQDDAIAQQLTQVCPDATVILQVIQDLPELHIYLNRETAAPLDYDRLQQQFVQTIATLNLPSLQGIWLYSRVMGEVEPDWQNYVSIQPRVANATQHASVTPTQNRSTQANPSEKTQSVISPSAEQNSRSHRVSGQESPSGKESASKPKSSVQENSPVAGISALPTTAEDTPAIAPSQLGDYCFIRNCLMLTADLVPPSKAMAQLVQSFHDLSQADQGLILPTLDEAFRMGTPEPSGISAEAQTWLAQLAALKGEDIRKVPIWMSRYCFDPEATLTTVQKVLNPPGATADRPQSAASENATSASNPDPTIPPPDPSHPHNAERSPSRRNPHEQPQPQRSPEHPSAGNRSAQSTPQNRSTAKKTTVSPWAFFAGQFVVGVIILMVVVQFTAPPSVAKVCGSKRSPYCKLLTEMVGTRQLQAAAQSAKPLSETAKAFGIDNCAKELTDLIELKTKQKPDLDQTPPKTLQEDILPGIWVADVQIGNGAQAERLACVYAGGEQDTDIDLVAIDKLPAEWPQKRYEPIFSPAPREHALNTYNALVALGANAVFTAIGLAGASFLGLSIRFYSLQGLVRAAIVLGWVETLFSTFLPSGFNPFGIAVQCVMLMITSVFVKDFKIDWASGYFAVSTGVIVLSIIRWVLHLILFGALLSLFP